MFLEVYYRTPVLNDHREYYHHYYTYVPHLSIHFSHRAIPAKKRLLIQLYYSL